MSISMINKPDTKPIFPPFDFPSWSAIDDRVRGGSSISHLDPVDVEFVDRGIQKHVKAARFWGNLNIATLGGAGFASQRYNFFPYPLHLPKTLYTGIKISILIPSIPSKDLMELPNPKVFTIVLKTSPSSTPLSPGRTKPLPASITYESNFTVSSSATLTTGSTEEYSLDWKTFVPVYRGREVLPSDPRYKPLDPNGIYEFSLMCRSGFGRQAGDFEVVIINVDGLVRGDQREVGEGTEGKREDGLLWRISHFFGRMFSWLVGFVGYRSDGRVRLVDGQDEKDEQ